MSKQKLFENLTSIIIFDRMLCRRFGLVSRRCRSLETKPNHLLAIRSKITLEVRFQNIFRFNNFAQKPWCDTFVNWVGNSKITFYAMADPEYVKVSHLTFRAKLGDTENYL